MKALSATLVRVILLISIITLTPAAHAIVTITGADGVIYDIYDGTMNVKVSKMNTSLFRGAVTDITIPVQVVDHATTAVTTEPYTVIDFDASAFKDCTGLRNIVIEAPLTQIPKDAFYGCSGIATVTLPETITKIADQAFYSCSKMTTISECPNLTEIGQSAFYECSSLQAFTFPEGLTKMGKWAFMNCKSLEEIALPSTLKTIEQADFQGCTALKKLSFRKD